MHVCPMIVMPILIFISHDSIDRNVWKISVWLVLTISQLNRVSVSLHVWHPGVLQSLASNLAGVEPRRAVGKVKAKSQADKQEDHTDIKPITNNVEPEHKKKTDYQGSCLFSQFPKKGL